MLQTYLTWRESEDRMENVDQKQRDENLGVVSYFVALCWICFLKNIKILFQVKLAAIN